MRVCERTISRGENMSKIYIYLPIGKYESFLETCFASNASTRVDMIDEQSTYLKPSILLQ